MPADEAFKEFGGLFGAGQIGGEVERAVIGERGADMGDKSKVAQVGVQIGISSPRRRLFVGFSLGSEPALTKTGQS